jgi:hypothetical protein
VETIVTRPGGDGARLLVPARHRRAAAYAITRPAPGRPRSRRLLAGAVLAAARAGLPVPGTLTLGTRTAGPPATLAALATVPAGSEWVLLRGEGDDLQRLVWLCLPPGAPEPAWAVKTTRVAGNDAPFGRDAAALAHVGALPADLRARAPRIVERTSVDGRPVVVETAAVGEPLHIGLHAGEARWAVDAVADWITAVGLATSNEGGVFSHNDLGCWNVIVDRDAFTVVDWESAGPAGPPLWDLLYFLTDALSEATRPVDGAAKDAAVLALVRGQLHESATLFARLAAAAAGAGVETAAVGAVASACWEHHGRSAAVRAVRGRAHGVGAAVARGPGPLERLAAIWRHDPQLGSEWPAFANHSASRAANSSPGQS